MSSEIRDVGLRYVWGRWYWLEFDIYDQVERPGWVWPLNHGLQRFIRSWSGSVGRTAACVRTYDSPRMLTMMRCQPSSRVLRVEDVRGEDSDLWTPLMKAEIRG
ncbi:hypothetical protein Tco_0859639 [Tanacetum coccineum]|uniref:Uncharacterized protein n=1 Tax=Tanacetum coccineum TaxID=301880 RepID=A0ABQ5BFV2_9ASTR